MDQGNWLKDICLPTLVSDTGWISTNPSLPERGIRDYDRFIRFEHEPSITDLQLICQILHEDPKCPGWTGVWCRRYINKDGCTNAYNFKTTWDSSD